MQKKFLSGLFILLVMFFIQVDTVNAGIIGPNCTSCQGAVYDLSYNLVNIGLTNDVYDIYFKINTDTYTGGGMFIDSVAVKIAPSIVSASLLSSPASVPSGSTWSVINGGLNANGCSGAGSGFVCSESSGLGAALSTNASDPNVNNMWVWRETIAHGTLLTGIDAASVKVLFTDSSGNKVGALVSEGITLDPRTPTPVPDASTFLYLSIGLVFLVLGRLHFQNT